ncbi:MAG: hypothetical protein HYY44_05375 [Deltaproteobacteria bacterium]|nr:hypothetical protein [Deltaproteobacteria bacterium]
MNERTTIILERSILEKVRQKARQQHQTLRETIRSLILAGLQKASGTRRPPLKLPKLNLGAEKTDISSRTRLYEMWDREE